MISICSCQKPTIIQISVMLSLVLNIIMLGSVNGDSVNITLPASISFLVMNAELPTIGTPNPTIAEFSDAILTPGCGIRMSIQANSVNFTRPAEGGEYIPASKISWTTSSAVNGTGFSGTLSSSSFTPVFQGNADATSGSVAITWTLAAPGSNILAGTHTLTTTWKIESLAP